MLELKNIVFEVPVKEGATETRRIIDGLSLTIPNDSFTVITGPNGGGKSTLAKLIMGIEPNEEISFIVESAKTKEKEIPIRYEDDNTNS